MPWEKSYDETDVLERAMHAFWAQGYEATSMNDLVEATGINRGSIYAAYSSKHMLFMESLRYYDRLYRKDFLEQIAREHPPQDAIRATFEAAAKRCGSAGNPGGCLLVNTALEMSPHDPEVGDFVDASLREVENFFARMIRAAQANGTVRKELNPRQIAQALLGLFLGLRVLVRSQPHRATVKSILLQVNAMLE